MSGRIFALGSASSAVLCVATCALWVRSYSVEYRVELLLPPHLYAIEVEQGNIYVPLYDAGTRIPYIDVFLGSHSVREGETWENIPHRRWAGIQVFGDCKFLTVSLSLPVLLTAISALILNRPSTIRGRGQCSKCGYDLRATPSRCPECGAVQPGIKQIAVDVANT